MFNKKIFLFSIISSVLFVGCQKKDPIASIAQVLLVPLSPNTSLVDFSINGNIVATGVGFSSTVGTVRYTLPYYTIEPKASSTISYNVNGLSTSRANVTRDLSDESVYSTFLIDTGVLIKAVIVKDDMTEPTPAKVKIRFFHFSPRTVNMDVEILGTTTKLFTNRSFNDQFLDSKFENFIEIDPGIYTFLFKNTATGATLFTTTAQTLLTDRIYTLAARGLPTGTGSLALGAWVYPNKP